MSAEIQTFSSEQVLGLEAVAFDLVAPVHPKSLARILLNEPKRFDHVNSSASLHAIVPKATYAAVRSRKLAIPGSNSESLDNQREMVAALEVKVKRQKLPAGATLEGVVFELSHVSTHFQVEEEYRIKNHGKPLYVGKFARTEDPTSDSEVAVFGRRIGEFELNVFGRFRDKGSSFIWAVPVAVPAKK